MILLSWNNKTWDDGYRTRTVLLVEKWGRGVSLSISDQFLRDGEWNLSHIGETGVSITPHPSWGSEHMWYDGPHCFFSIGFIHFRWTNWRCKRCSSDK